MAQVPAGYWQQRVEYQIDIRLDDQTHAVQGRAKIKYINHSPDTLQRVFFHLYWNAFQPKSAYAKWVNQVQDPYVNTKLLELKPDEIGRQDIFTVQQNGIAIGYKVNETIMEVTLSRPLLPGDFDVFDVAWQGQVPVIIKRGGRNSSAGVAYTFTQWYPKICAYDRKGWHADPYIGREFYGEFGSFKVDITLPKKYVVAATGVLQNAANIGYGYENEGVAVKPNYGLVNVWKFTADNVHDFAWSADPEYKHEKVQVRDDLTLHFFYQPGTESDPSMQYLKQYAAETLPLIEANFGRYRYPQFSFVEGGEWAMEYPMMTLIEKVSPSDDLRGTAVHEWMHNWYYGMLGNNENDEHWLDEGFASYAASVILAASNGADAASLRRAALETVVRVGAQVTEPAALPANFYHSSDAYFFNAYAKGEAFLWQLRYIVGDEAFEKALLRYYAVWCFKHPTGDDFVRAVERASGMELDWFQACWLRTTKTIDYGVEKVAADGSTATVLTLKRLQEVPLPVEVLVKYKDGSSEWYYIPTDYQRGLKKMSDKTVIQEPWSFAADTYDLRLNKSLTSIQAITIDPEQRTADVDRANNQRLFP